MPVVNSTDKGRLALATVALASAGAVGLALISQHAFGLWPCDLCYLQRVPYALNLLLGGLCIMPAVPPCERRIVLMHCALLFALGAGFAGYHVGVEEHWWAGPTSCSGGGAISLDDLATALTQSVLPSCDEAAFRLLGISMAGYNFAASLFLAGFCIWAMRKLAWWDKQ